MTAVDIDLESIWDAPAFEVLVTPLHGDVAVLPERVADVTKVQGETAFVATWYEVTAVVDAARIRVGEATKRMDLQKAHVRGRQLSIIVRERQLP